MRLTKWINGRIQKQNDEQEFDLWEIDVIKKLAAYEDAEEQGLLVRTPYKVGDLFWAVAYSDPRVIHVRLYQVTYHYKDGQILWVENIDNENDWWKVPLETFEAWSSFDSYEEAEAAMKGETEDV